MQDANLLAFLVILFFKRLSLHETHLIPFWKELIYTVYCARTQVRRNKMRFTMLLTKCLCICDGGLLWKIRKNN